MALTKRSETNTIYLEVKHYCLWQSVKSPIGDCEEITVTNPTNGQSVKKYGYRYNTLSGRAVKLVKYDTEQKYGTRYFGFKLHVIDGIQTYVLDMPYQSQILRRFLRVARNIDWSLPFSITIFKGKGKEGKKAGAEETGVWFQQRGETVKPYYSREQTHGMPAATYDDTERKWDFKSQHRWLIDRLKSETMPAIEAAAPRSAPPIEPEAQEPDAPEPDQERVHSDYITDDDVPF